MEEAPYRRTSRFQELFKIIQGFVQALWASHCSHVKSYDFVIIKVRPVKISRNQLSARERCWHETNCRIEIIIHWTTKLSGYFHEYSRHKTLLGSFWFFSHQTRYFIKKKTLSKLEFLTLFFPPCLSQCFFRDCKLRILLDAVWSWS